MAFTINVRTRQWIQIAALITLGAVVAASAAWGQINESAPDKPADSIVQDAYPQQGEDLVWPAKTIDEIQIDPRDFNEGRPPDKSGDLLGKASPEHWFNAEHPPLVAHWVAPNIYYQPLYFEDVALERYGQQHWGHPLDLGRTGILFYGGVLALPINLWRTPAHGCDTLLGFARPGSSAPCTYHRLIHTK